LGTKGITFGSSAQVPLPQLAVSQTEAPAALATSAAVRSSSRTAGSDAVELLASADIYVIFYGTSR